MIDYGRLDRSVQYYTTQGFSRIESPWLVSSAVVDITCPPGKKRMEVIGKGKELVASGEQSFLYLYLKGFLPKGKFQTITPCFRDDQFDLSHSKYFMKNELIITDTVNDDELRRVTNQAKAFFTSETEFEVYGVRTAEGYDLMINEYEVGSYGIRETEYLTWIYATGLAEPRMTMAIMKGNHELSRTENTKG